MRRHSKDLPDLLDEVVDLDQKRRAKQTLLDELRSELNIGSKLFGMLKQIGENTINLGDYSPEHVNFIEKYSEGNITDNTSLSKKALDAIQESLRILSDKVEVEASSASSIDNELNSKLSMLPNIPLKSVPDGSDETDNKEVRIWGEPKTTNFTPLPHWEIGTGLNIIDFERGVKMSGSRFYVLKGQGARLQRSLIQWMLDLHTSEHQYTEIYPPFVVTENALYGSGQLPKFISNIYRDIEDDLWLVPTAEVPLTAMHAEEILSEEQLPINYVAYTPSFRREKMSAGRDIRGIKRGHQFDKVELYKYVKPENSLRELETLVQHAETILQKLELPYRVVELCAGDLGTAAAKTYDIEVWSPGSEEWLEVSSCSTTEDFQSRRSNIRYRDKSSKKNVFVHTLNGSGLALPRLVIAILENYQDAEGNVEIPEIIRKYTGFNTIERAY